MAICLVLGVIDAREPELSLGRDPERSRQLCAPDWPKGHITHVSWMLPGSTVFRRLRVIGCPPRPVRLWGASDTLHRTFLISLVDVAVIGVGAGWTVPWARFGVDKVRVRSLSFCDALCVSDSSSGTGHDIHLTLVPRLRLLIC